MGAAGLSFQLGAGSIFLHMVLLVVIRAETSTLVLPGQPTNPKNSRDIVVLRFGFFERSRSLGLGLGVMASQVWVLGFYYFC